MSNKSQRDIDRMINESTMRDRRQWRKLTGGQINIYTPIMIIVIVVIWELAARSAGTPFLFPQPTAIIKDFINGVLDLYVLRNIKITMLRVLKGAGVAIIFGIPIGMIMGYNSKIMMALNPFINSLRQIPIMAWVPLSIIWFGLGDGPTIFMIAFTAVFTVILNTIAGVQSINQDYFNAARSMGASTINVFKDILIPGAMPGIFTGIRLAIGQGWMSVM